MTINYIFNSNYNPFYNYPPNDPVKKDPQPTKINTESPLDYSLQPTHIESVTESALKKPQELSSQLHTGIRSIHSEARKNEFLRSLIDGKMTFCSKAYVCYLCNLFVLHETIEQAQSVIVKEHGEDFFVFPVLFRSERLLNDIKMWSMFNTLSPKFADKDIHSDEFKEKVRSIAETCTKDFARQIEGDSSVIANLYALYGTVISGGQLVKGNNDTGVMSGFICRIEDTEEEEETSSDLKKEIRNKIAENPELKQFYAEQSVSFFNFSEEDFSIPTFKQIWHKNLDQLISKLNLDETEKNKFVQELIPKAKGAVGIVLELIESLLKNVDKY